MASHNSNSAARAHFAADVAVVMSIDGPARTVRSRSARNDHKRQSVGRTRRGSRLQRARVVHRDRAAPGLPALDEDSVSSSRDDQSVRPTCEDELRCHSSAAIERHDKTEERCSSTRSRWRATRATCSTDRPAYARAGSGSRTERRVGRSHRARLAHRARSSDSSLSWRRDIRTAPRVCSADVAVVRSCVRSRSASLLLQAKRL